MSQATAAVEFDKVSKRYGRTLALDEVSLAVKEGEFFALLGPNGAGKTTLLHILCTILPPDSGRARVRGFDVLRQPRTVRKALGVVFQEPSLDDRLTVEENLDFHGLVYGVPAKLRRERIAQLLEVVELGERREAVVRTLSSGMKRRLEIARALVHDSRILVLDEPTVGLDAQSREAIWRHVQSLRDARGLTVIVTTHYVEEVEGCDRVCIIDSGRIAALDTPDRLRAEHGTETLRLMARDEETSRQILDHFGRKARLLDAYIVVTIEDPADIDGLLGRWGNRLRELLVERSSLEGVFLKLTGHELRDRLAGPRERTGAFGRQGGEHTR